MENNGSGSSIAKKSKWKTPKNFFPVVVDNFFEDPYAIVELGKSLPKEIVGRQPGNRSRQLWEIDGALHNAIIEKVLSCYYDLDYVSLSWEMSNCSFHEIPRYSPGKKDITNKGWVHQDEYISEVAGLIYLTPDIDPDSGTSLWSLKHDVKPNPQANFFYDQDKKQWFAEDGSFSSGEEYEKQYLTEIAKFEEKVRFQNIFNRMIMYDTMEWHGANSYYHESRKDPRLTMAFFIGGIESQSEFPLSRIRRRELYGK